MRTTGCIEMRAHVQEFAWRSRRLRRGAAAPETKRACKADQIWYGVREHVEGEKGVGEVEFEGEELFASLVGGDERVSWCCSQGSSTMQASGSASAVTERERETRGFIAHTRAWTSGGKN
jgi:hypothetical protein